MTLADTSEWVEYDRATGSPVDRRMIEPIRTQRWRPNRRCRRVGVTPRGLIDCMTVAVGWRRGATLLAHDVGLDRVAGVIGLELDGASLRA